MEIWKNSLKGDEADDFVARKKEQISKTDMFVIFVKKAEWLSDS